MSGDSDENGRFQLSGLGSGLVIVNAAADGWTRSAPVEVVVKPGETREDLVIRLVRSSAISGRLIAADQGVSGAVVRWVPSVDPDAVEAIRSAQRVRPHGTLRGLDARRGSGAAISQQDGSFVIDNISPGPGIFWVEGYEVLSPTSFVVEAEPAEDVEVRVAAMGSLAGVVTRGDKPAGHAWVAIRNSSERGAGQRKQCDGDGRFDIGGLTAGKYTVSASDDAAASAQTTIELTTGQRIDGIEIALERAGKISGTVSDQKGDPVAGAQVQFRLAAADSQSGTADRGSATTGADGSFTIGALAGGGPYRAEVESSQGDPLSPPGGKPFPEIPLSGADQEVTGVALVVAHEQGAIAGTVVDSSGNPQSDIAVRALGMGRRTAGEGARAITGIDGRFSLTVPSGGEIAYRVTALSPLGASGRVDNVAVGNSAVEIALSENGSIEGSVIGFTGTPKISILAMDGAGGVVRRHTSPDPSGVFRFEGLPPAAYNLSAWTVREEVKTSVTVAPGEVARIELQGVPRGQ